MNTLEAAATRAWREWGEFRKWTYCAHCQRFTPCVGKTSSGPFVCVVCHDLLINDGRLT